MRSRADLVHQQRLELVAICKVPYACVLCSFCAVHFGYALHATGDVTYAVLVGVVVVDELHMVGDAHRGYLLDVTSRTLCLQVLWWWMSYTWSAMHTVATCSNCCSPSCATSSSSSSGTQAPRRDRGRYPTVFTCL